MFFFAAKSLHLIIRTLKLSNVDNTIAGEAIGKWQKLQPMKANVTVLDDGRYLLPNVLELPFRCQSDPGKNIIV